MKPGDTVQISQLESSILRAGEEPTAGVVHWIYATVLEVLKDGDAETAATVEIDHPANREHGVRKVVKRAGIRTVEDLKALHDGHPAKDFKGQLDPVVHPAHRELINVRAAIERIAPETGPPGPR
jgi:hypothetical protein